MIAHPSTLGNYTADNFFKTPIIANEYIPFFAFQTSSKGYYNKPSLENVVRKPNTVKNIKDAFQMAMTPRRITIGNKVYFFVKGVMFTDTGTPLMVFAMPREKYLNPDIKKFSEIRYSNEVNPVDYKDFVLFYSTSFFTEPNLAPLNRRFQKEILMSCYQKGIEVRVITSQEIERNTFADLFEIPKANSVSQLEEYMSKVLPTYLFTEGEDTFVFDELGTVQAQNEELSIEEEALLFDSEPVELLPIFETNYYDEDQVEREEMEREAATWENSAHTEYPVTVDEAHPSIVYPNPQTAASLVERMRPLQNEYNMQMQTYMNLVSTGENLVHADYAIANAEAAITAHVTQVGDVTWRSRRVGSRDTRPIELIDDEV
jgi:hypothetical protein